MLSPIAQEFARVDLRDRRLNRRLIACAERIAAQPAASFPKIFGEKSAGMQAFYRLIESPYVRHEALHRPHVESTLARFGDVDDIIIAHDGSTFDNPAARGLRGREKRGEPSLLGHFSLAIRHGNHEPLGLVHMRTWVRPADTRTSLKKAGKSASSYQHLPSEMDNWLEGIRAVSDLRDDSKRLIHVCDSEADSYRLLAGLVADQARFVIRGCYNRRIKDFDDKLREMLQSQPLITQRQVKLAKRGKPIGTTSRTRNEPREQRNALLEIRSAQVNISRPHDIPASVPLPSTIRLNVVYVREVDAPEDMVAVEWILLTSEPINSPEHVLRVVDCYRARWKIEEFFKALKTGCAYESRQLESLETLRNVMAIFAAIAWHLLHIRFLSRCEEETPAEQVLTSDCIEMLSLKIGRPIHTARQALQGIASLGGHIKNNGAPGWLVLWRGMQDLLMLAEGARLIRETARMSTQRCDQS